MKKKILSFIVKNKQFLALYSEPHPKHGKGGWFTVTGSLEKDENYEDAIKREVLEETGLVVKKIISLNQGSKYKWQNELCLEFNYLSFVNSGDITLNEEHSNFKWLSLNEFVDKIKWDGDKEILKLVLKKALKNDLYFKKKEIKNYTK
jgi:dihydroneopterin triphosphate diphosphatase